MIGILVLIMTLMSAFFFLAAVKLLFGGPMVDTLLGAQNADGSWPPEPQKGFARFGNAYTTAMAVLALTPPYQLLPVYQR